MILNLPHDGISRFQEIFVPLCSLLALRAFLRTWRGRTSRISGFLGFLLWCGAAIAIAMPDLTSVVAQHVGIHRGADLVLYLSILGGVGVCFYFYQRTRRMENLVTELVRREAVRNAEFGAKKIENS